MRPGEIAVGKYEEDSVTAIDPTGINRGKIEIMDLGPKEASIRIDLFLEMKKGPPIQIDRWLTLDK